MSKIITIISIITITGRANLKSTPKDRDQVLNHKIEGTQLKVEGLLDIY